MVIGRGHTVYLDNKSIDYNGQTYGAYDEVVIEVKGEKVADLLARDRGMCTWLGQNFRMTLLVTDDMGAQPRPLPSGPSGPGPGGRRCRTWRGASWLHT